MKKLSLIFLILAAFSLTAFAQTEEKSETKEAYKFFEYEKISDKLLKEKFADFCSEVNKTSWIGWIINYGTTEQIEKRENQILKNLKCDQEFPSPRITIVNGGKSEKSKTIIWIVPPGEEPKIK